MNSKLRLRIDVEWLEQHLSFDMNERVHVFELTIRALGETLLEGPLQDVLSSLNVFFMLSNRHANRTTAQTKLPHKCHRCLQCTVHLLTVKGRSRGSPVIEAVTSGPLHNRLCSYTSIQQQSSAAVKCSSQVMAASGLCSGLTKGCCRRLAVHSHDAGAEAADCGWLQRQLAAPQYRPGRPASACLQHQVRHTPQLGQPQRVRSTVLE